jgi:hypothetical protein
VVFTVPHELNVLALTNARLFYELLFSASAAAAIEGAADARHLGAEIGMISILHTWGQNLLLHRMCTASFRQAGSRRGAIDGFGPDTRSFCR